MDEMIKFKWVAKGCGFIFPGKTSKLYRKKTEHSAMLVCSDNVPGKFNIHEIDVSPDTIVLEVVSEPFLHKYIFPEWN